MDEVCVAHLLLDFEFVVVGVVMILVRWHQ